MLIGVATRQYGAESGTARRRRHLAGHEQACGQSSFVAQTQAQLDAWRATPLDALDLVGLLIDGVHMGGHCIVAALGIDTMGRETPARPVGRGHAERDGLSGALDQFASRGLRTDRSLLVIVDGAKALDTSVTQTFGRAALVQRCQVHKGSGTSKSISLSFVRPWVKAVSLTRAYTNSHVKDGQASAAGPGAALGH